MGLVSKMNTDSNNTEIMSYLLFRKYGKGGNIAIPNLEFGLNFEYEKDLVIIYPSGYATEIEIKSSRRDLIKDKQKDHAHDSKYMRRLFFAIPEFLDNKKTIKHIPTNAGIIVIMDNGGIHEIRKPEINKNAVKISNSIKLGLLTTMTYKINTYMRKYIELKGLIGNE